MSASGSRPAVGRRGRRRPSRRIGPAAGHGLGQVDGPRGMRATLTHATGARDRAVRSSSGDQRPDPADRVVAVPAGTSTNAVPGRAAAARGSAPRPPARPARTPTPAARGRSPPPATVRAARRRRPARPSRRAAPARPASRRPGRRAPGCRPWCRGCGSSGGRPAAAPGAAAADRGGGRVVALHLGVPGQRTDPDAVVVGVGRTSSSASRLMSTRCAGAASRIVSTGPGSARRRAPCRRHRPRRGRPAPRRGVSGRW